MSRFVNLSLLAVAAAIGVGWSVDRYESNHVIQSLELERSLGGEAPPSRYSRFFDFLEPRGSESAPPAATAVSSTQSRSAGDPRG